MESVNGGIYQCITNISILLILVAAKRNYDGFGSLLLVAVKRDDDRLCCCFCCSFYSSCCGCCYFFSHISYFSRTHRQCKCSVTFDLFVSVKYGPVKYKCGRESNISMSVSQILV